MNFIRGMKFKMSSLGFGNELHLANEVQNEVARLEMNFINAMTDTRKELLIGICVMKVMVVKK